jgi:hypothetical protein
MIEEVQSYKAPLQRKMKGERVRNGPIVRMWRDLTAGDGSIGPKRIPKPELKSYEVETRLLISEGYGVIARAYSMAPVVLTVYRKSR